jgi:hypothetical protein
MSLGAALFATSTVSWVMKAVTLCLVGVLATCGIAIAQSESTTSSSPTATAAPRAQVDLNTADIPALEAVPEIGTDLANAVVSGRPYKSVDDAARVLKLAPEKMATLRPKVFVSPPKPAAPASPNSPNPANTATSAPSKPPQTNDGQAIPRQEVTERYDRAQPKAAAPKK